MCFQTSEPRFISAADRHCCSPSRAILNVLACFPQWFESVFEIWIELTLIPTIASNVPIQPSADGCNSGKKRALMTSDGVVLLTGSSISWNVDSLMSDRCIFSLQLRLYWFSLAFRWFEFSALRAVFQEEKSMVWFFYHQHRLGFLSVWNNQRNLLRTRALASRTNCFYKAHGKPESAHLPMSFINRNCRNWIEMPSNFNFSGQYSLSKVWLSKDMINSCFFCDVEKQHATFSLFTIILYTPKPKKLFSHN